MSSTQPEPDYSHLSPFELKNELIRYARDYSQSKSATSQFLNAGRGNPNWIATTPREAYFILGQFALGESKRVWDEPDLGGMPHMDGIAERLRSFLSAAGDSPGVRLLWRGLEYGVDELGFSPDAFVHELVDSIIGDNYPVPDRMLLHTERVVHRFLEKAMCADHPPSGKFDLFAVEGGTAAMCYVFKSLMANGVLASGDTIALGTPIFTPYIEMAHLEEHAFETVEVRATELADGLHTWQYPDEEIARLEDPRVKAFFLVNPSNPASFAMRQDTQERLIELVRTKRPDLLILTDDVYGTFVEGFRSLAAELPRNTILVYSYSKHFGCTGWRLGVVGIHEDNVIDEVIAALPEAERRRLNERYRPISTAPSALKFIDRMVADSRDVALNHTAGLSLPQQAQMTLFSLFHLLDEDDEYTRRCRSIVRERLARLAHGFGVELPHDALRAAYYADVDIEAWGRAHFGDDFIAYVERHHDPLDIVLTLARRFGTVLLNGSGFAGPPWSARVSLANLNAEEYEAIGRQLAQIVEKAVENWRNAGPQGGAS